MLQITTIYDNFILPEEELFRNLIDDKIKIGYRTKEKKANFTLENSKKFPRSTLFSDWGFSALVEFEDRKILFDTGTNGEILLNNMEKLGIYQELIDNVFISHNHFDHVGGLSSFLNVNKEVNLYVPKSIRGIKNVKNVFYVDKSRQLYDNIYSTGLLQKKEQSLIIKTKYGLIIIVGCSHPGVRNILKSAVEFGEPFFLIGGLHGFKEFKILKDIKYISATHCTQYRNKIKNIYPQKWIEGGVGRVYKILY